MRIFKKTARFLLIFLLIASWIYIGWPRIWQNPTIPPKIQEAQAAIALRGTPKLTTGLSGLDITLTFDTGAGAPQTGDVVIFFGGHGNDGVSTAFGPNTAGYTLINSVTGADVQIGAWYKVMEATPDLTVVGEGGDDAGDSVAYGAYVIDGTTLNSAIFDQTATIVGQVTGIPDGPAIVTQTAGAMVITLAGEHLNDATAGTVTGYTNYVMGSSNDTDDCGLAAATKIVASPTTEDPAAWSGWLSANYIAITIALKPSVTTLGTGTDPASATVAPESGIRDAGSFTFSTTASSDSITALTVVLSSGSGYDNLSEVRVTSDNGATTYFSAISNPTSDSLDFSGGTPIPVTGSSVQFKIRVTPETHANMPVPPGGNYTFSPYVSAFTSGGNTAGSDSNTNTLTIDNTSPNGATAVSGSAGNAKVTVNWTTSNSGDFNTTSGSVIYRWASGSAGSEVPVEGSTPSIGDPNGTATVACVVSSAASTPLSKIDGSGGSAECTTAALTNGQAYTYIVFQKDSNGNYDYLGVLIGTFTPVAPGPSITAPGTAEFPNFQIGTGATSTCENMGNIDVQGDNTAWTATAYMQGDFTCSGNTIAVANQLAMDPRSGQSGPYYRTVLTPGTDDTQVSAPAQFTFAGTGSGNQETILSCSTTNSGNGEYRITPKLILTIPESVKACSTYSATIVLTVF